MKPPYDLTPEIIKYVVSISEKIGAMNSKYLIKQNPTLRKQNRIKTIHSSLSIEGNTLTEEQITALLENKRIVGPEKDIKEVLNASKVYKELFNFNHLSEKDFLKAHKMLMNGLIEYEGKYRTKGVGIIKGSKVENVAPPSKNIPFLMKELFQYLKDKSEITLIKSCVFHYEMEFIHPFLDGNGRMGRLWQTLILIQEYPIFEFLPFETIIAKNQKQYYKALSLADKQGKSSVFIEFMLKILDMSLTELLGKSTKKLNDEERMELFLENCKTEFTRKDYLKYFTDLSTATASRDLLSGVSRGLIEKFGDKKLSVYRIRKSENPKVR
jgi:Fic family protein